MAFKLRSVHDRSIEVTEQAKVLLLYSVDTWTGNVSLANLTHGFIACFVFLARVMKKA